MLARMTSSPVPLAISHVHLVGRLGTRIERRQLPSGDELLSFVVVVDRPAVRGGDGRLRVDAIACHAVREPLMRRIEGLAPGTWVRAEGVLRRRFWRAGPSPTSATEVEVNALTRYRAARASMGA